MVLEFSVFVSSLVSVSVIGGIMTVGLLEFPGHKNVHKQEYGVPGSPIMIL
jgi:hypothetical protein